MKIRNIIRSAATALTAALILPFAVSCGNTTAADTTAGSQTEPPPEKKSYTVIENGTSNYSIKAGRMVTQLCTSSLELMQNAFRAVYGTSPATDGTAPFIELAIEGGRRDCCIEFDEGTGNIRITGGSAPALDRAVGVFVAKTCAGVRDGRLTADSDLDYSFEYDRDKTDNSGLLEYIPTESVKLVPGNASGSIMSPEWVDSLIMVELRTEVASIGGALQDSYDLIDFYASVGVNGIWLTPVYEKGENGNGYVNIGPHSVDGAYYDKGAGSTASDYSAGWQAVREFVDYAHSKGVYVLLDIITWGVNKNAPLTAGHPDWFAGESWGNTGFNWANAGLREWFIQTCVNNILSTGADGYRCDCEPEITGYDIFGEIRSRLAAAGKYVAIISEAGSNRSATYDFEQDGVLKYSEMDRGQYYSNPVNFFVDGQLDIVDSVKNGTGLGYMQGQHNADTAGTGKYYTNCLSNHDFLRRSVCGDRQKIGYAAILAPFIPLWYMGDEFNASYSEGVQYFQRVVYAETETEAKAMFLEDVRKMINIRRSYPEIFEYWPINHRDSNICEVKVDGISSLQNYARYAGNRAVVVIANNDPDCSGVGNVSIPFEAAGISGYKRYTVTDLMTGVTIAAGTAEQIDGFTAVVAYRGVGVYMICGE